ncbi:MAG: integrase arm-type DNA-binding domain-containing protein, partial [Gammaproteobacteria bacterium]
MAKLTDIQVRNWITAGDPIAGKSDGNGLTLTISKRGHASWTFRYRIGGRARELTLGHYPNLTLAHARKLARAARSRVDGGHDPALEKRARIEEALKAERRSTMTALASEWYTRIIVPKWKYHVKVKQVLDKHVLPIIGRLPAEDVKPADIDRVLDGILRKHAPTVANDALTYLKGMFAYGRKRRILDYNPAADFDMADAGGKETPRSRALNRDELKKLFEAMQKTPNLGRENFLTFLLLLALCVRKGELVAAQWAEFELDNGIWHLPAERTKTKAALDIPLAAPVVQWLRELKVFAAGSGYVLPARTRSKRYPHVSPDTLNAA